MSGPAPLTIPAPPGTIPPPGVSAPLPPVAPRRRRRWIPVLAVVVAAVVVAGLLYSDGFFGRATSTPPGSGASSPWQAYSGAEAISAKAAKNVSGGPWFPVVAAAFDVSAAALVPGTNLTAVARAAGCNVTWPSGVAPSLSVPATISNAPVGHAGFWVVGFRNAAGELLLESVSLGNASLLGTATGSSCESNVSALNEIPATVVDSPQVVRNASAAGGGAFLAAHPNATQSWVVFGGITIFGFPSGAVWMVSDTTCALPATVAETGAVFNATLSGLTGIVTAHANGSVNCVLTAGVTLSLLTPGVGPGISARKAI